MSPNVFFCIDCDKPTVGDSVLCERCLQEEKTRQASGIVGNDRPAVLADIEQKIEPQEIAR